VVSLDTAEVKELLGIDEFPQPLEEIVTSLGAGVEQSSEGQMDVEFFPNRPDLYSVEGVVRALRAYLGMKPGLASYPLAASEVSFEVDPSVETVRPYVVGALVRSITLSDRLVRSLVDLQEKLHLTVGRKRSKVAIGIHDFDRVEPPFTYKAVEPQEVGFVPLGSEEAMDLQQILDEHEKGKEFGHILRGHQRYPIITDAEGRVLSFPPIINGVVTALTESTKNIFIDVTGTEEQYVNVALNIVTTALAERGGRINTILMGYPGGERRTPDLTPRTKTLDAALVNSLLGLSLTPKEAADYLKRMGHAATLKGKRITVRSPSYRADILHPVDYIEDIAWGYGVHRFPTVLPKAVTIGSAHPLNDLREQVTNAMIGYGFQEVMTLELVTPGGTPKSPNPPTKLINPISEDTSVLRSSLLPSLINILMLNRHRELPQRIFEVAEVVVDGRNELHMAGAIVHARAGFTEGKSLVQGLARDLGIRVDFEPQEEESFLPGRGANLVTPKGPWGFLGEVHPSILEAYGLGYPVVAFEVELSEDRSLHHKSL
jgi:phenylalanyl-tRNA synthetase beta chain